MTAEEPRLDLVVGAIDGADFQYPFLRADIVIWRGEFVRGVEDKTRAGLSASYSYKAEITPGELGGQAFDGKMVGLVGNHVALVELSRTGTAAADCRSAALLVALRSKYRRPADVPAALGLDRRG